MRDNRFYIIGSETICLIIIGLSFCACGVSDIKGFETDATIHHEYSLPLGSYLVQVDNMVDKFELSPLLPEDELVYPNLFQYRGYTFRTPYEYDTVFITRVDLSEFRQYSDKISYLMFRGNVENCSHATIWIQGYFSTSNPATRIDSIFVDGPLKISSSEFNGGDIIQCRSSLKNDVHFPQNRIQSILSSTKIEVYVRCKFPDFEGKPVIYPDSMMISIQMAFRAGVDMDLNEFK